MTIRDPIHPPQLSPGFPGVGLAVTYDMIYVLKDLAMAYMEQSTLCKNKVEAETWKDAAKMAFTLGTKFEEWLDENGRREQ